MSAERPLAMRGRVGRRARGVSIFEVLIAFIVLQTGMLVSVQMLMTGTQFGARARRATQATLAAQARLEQVLRDVVPTVSADQVAAAGGVLFVPEAPAPVTDVDSPGDMTWQATLAGTDTPGLYDVAVTVTFRGQRGRPEAATLATRAFAPGPGAL